MSLATRCPTCNTLFKVTSGQLQLHEGNVRCGQCQNVFSGIEHLTTADAMAWQALDLNPEQAETVEPPPASNNDSETEPLFPTAKPAKPLFNFSRPSPAIKAAGIGLLVLLALQTLWLQRTGLLENTPGLAGLINRSGPGIQQLFAAPATQSLLVEGSGLQALDENNLRVDITLRNQNNLPAQWPHLKVDLLDTQGLLLASKSLGPSDYQLRDDKSASESGLIQGKTTVEVLAYLNLSTLNSQLPESAATGFRLALFDESPGTP